MSLVIIRPTNDSRKAVQLAGGRTSNETLIQLGVFDGPEGKNLMDRLWIFNGTTFISYKNPIKCLTLARSQTRNGTKIVLFNILADDNPNRLIQQWRYEKTNIVSRKNASACWHLENGSTRPGTKIQLWDVKNHKNGSWQISRLKSSPSRLSFRRRALCMIVPMKSQGKTVRLIDGKTDNGTKIELGDKVALGNIGYENQLWLLDGSLIRSSKNNGKCLHIENGETPKIHLWDVGPRNHPNQLWRVEGKNIVCMKNSACWHLENGRTDNGTKIVLGNDKNHENGFWKIEWVFSAKM